MSTTEKGINVLRLEWVLIKGVFATDLPAPQCKGFLQKLPMDAYIGLWSNVNGSGAEAAGAKLLQEVEQP
jgi:hypothetical protein